MQKLVSISGDEVTIEFKAAVSFSLYVAATAPKSKQTVFKEMKVKIEEPPPPPNMGPVVSGPIKSSFELQVFENGDKSKIEYISPVIMDPEGDDIIL